MVRDLQPWEEVVSTGEVVGKDPRGMTQEEFRALGHRPLSPIAALRARCLDCCGGSAQEVRYCTARKCPSWPFRMGQSPWREKRVLTPEQKQALADNLAGARKNRRISIKPEGSDE